MELSRFEKQLQFIVELDKLKNIYRQSLVLHEDRQENDAEHSFHLAIMICLLAEYANEPIDVLHTMKMVLVHDVVEIDAGDTYFYDAARNADKEERELKAADRLFALLPEEQEKEFRGLWEEFEAKKTPEAKASGVCLRFMLFWGTTPVADYCSSCRTPWGTWLA